MRVASKFDAIDYDDLSNPSVMAAFYRRLFPAKQLYSWLNQDHGEPVNYASERHDGTADRDRRLTAASNPVPTKQWTNREIAFTLANDAYLVRRSLSSRRGPVERKAGTRRGRTAPADSLLIPSHYVAPHSATIPSHRTSTFTKRSSA